MFSMHQQLTLLLDIQKWKDTIFVFVELMDSWGQGLEKTEK